MTAGSSEPPWLGDVKALLREKALLRATLAVLIIAILGVVAGLALIASAGPVRIYESR